MVVVYMHSGLEVLSALGLAVGVYLSLYPAMLLCPLLILAHKVSYLHCFIHCIRPGFLSQRRGLLGSVVYVMVTSAWTGLLFCGSHYLTGSWDFLSATHGVM